MKNYSFASTSTNSYSFVAFFIYIVSEKTEHMKFFHRGFACLIIILLSFAVTLCVCV